MRGFKDIDKKPVVVDIGAHCGYFSFAALALGAQKIYAFEPFIENYNLLLKNVHQNSMAPVISYQTGVYLTSVVLPFGYPQLIRGSYFDFGNVGQDTNTEVERVAQCPCVSLDSLLQYYVTEAVDILKISIGYAEVDILTASKLVGEKVTHICGETSIDEQGKSKLRALMAEKGFTQFSFADVKDEEGKVLFHFSKTNLADAFDLQSSPSAPIA
jgi:FkbM family methyltransferase